VLDSFDFDRLDYRLIVTASYIGLLKPKRKKDLAQLSISVPCRNMQKVVFVQNVGLVDKLTKMNNRLKLEVGELENGVHVLEVLDVIVKVLGGSQFPFLRRTLKTIQTIEMYLVQGSSVLLIRKSRTEHLHYSRQSTLKVLLDVRYRGQNIVLPP
jgi:hypothetical protein